MAGSGRIDWESEEVILALALYLVDRPRASTGTEAPVIALSQELRGFRPSFAAAHPGHRSPSSVSMKIANLASLDAEHTATGRVGLTSKSQTDRAVWEEFIAAPEMFPAKAAAIRAARAEGLTFESLDVLAAVAEAEEEDSDDGEEQPFEGRLLEGRHRWRERKGQMPRKRKQAAFGRDGALCCEACGFNATAAFGDRAWSVIECHHIQPLSALTAPKRTRMRDLALLCANCHRAVHAKRPWLTVREVAALAATPNVDG